jgi:hypothetical protein
MNDVTSTARIESRLDPAQPATGVRNDNSDRIDILKYFHQH